MIGIDYVVPSDVGRDWRAGTTGEQHTRSCGCPLCTARRIDALFFRAAFAVREAHGPGSVVVLSPEFTPPVWLASC